MVWQLTFLPVACMHVITIPVQYQHISGSMVISKWLKIRKVAVLSSYTVDGLGWNVHFLPEMIPDSTMAACLTPLVMSPEACRWFAGCPADLTVRFSTALHQLRPLQSARQPNPKYASVRLCHWLSDWCWVGVWYWGSRRSLNGWLHTCRFQYTA